MPVMGRFRLRRESRRAFLQSAVCSQRSGPLVCGKLNGFHVALRVRKVNPPAFHRSSAERAQSKISSDTRKKLFVFHRRQTSPDYFRGRSSP